MMTSHDFPAPIRGARRVSRGNNWHHDNMALVKLRIMG